MSCDLMRPMRVLILGVVLATVADAEAASSCPSGTRTNGAACLLDADLVIDQTLELGSFTTLNCRGHRILPSNAGTGTTPETYVPSVPEVAIAITGDRGIDVRNCIIGDDAMRFDFGIIAMNAKNARLNGHRIHNNELHARDSAITLLRVDDAHVSDNVITWTNGYGILIMRDSDRGRIANNVLSSPGLPAAPARIVPGGAFFSETDNAISLFQIPVHVLYSVIISGRLYQFPNSEDGQYPGTDDNVLKSNRISLPGSSVGKAHGGIYVAGNAARTRVIGNTVIQGGTGVRLAGLMPALQLQRAARCVDASGQSLDRYCETSADCFIPGIDTAPLGSCPTLQVDVIDGRAKETFVEGNTLTGPFNSPQVLQRAGIVGGNGTVGGIIRSNRVSGAGIEAGISLAGNMIETAEVTGNVVQGASFGLLLSQGAATYFGARVSLNDITGSTIRAIGVLGPYTLPTELSWDGSGNYWGHGVPPCFTAADSPILNLILDSYPFCAPVAANVGADLMP